MDKATIGNRIRYERQRAGLTLDELGNKVGVSKQCLSGWEHGRNMPDVVSLSILSKVFRVHIEDLLHEPTGEGNTATDSSSAFVTIAEEANPQIQLTEKETQLINKLRALSAERRKAIEILFGIRK